MSKEKQKTILESYILPLFPGAEVNETESSNPRDQLVATAPNRLKIKFEKEDRKRVVVTRSQPFSGNDSNLVKHFLQKIAEIDESKFYASYLYDVCLEKSICEQLSTATESVIYSIINIFSKWSTRTYEGKHPSFGVIIDSSKQLAPCKYDLKVNDCLLKDFSAPLTDGISSFFRVSCDGFIQSQEILNESASEEILAPYRFINFADKCNNGNVGLTLLSTGEILIFKDKEIKYAKRQGKWRYFDHKTSIKRLTDGSKYMDKTICKAMYLTSLDVSFSRTGGCIGFINKTQTSGAYSIINSEDCLIDNSKMNSKAKFVKKLVDDRQFQSLPRKMRQELAGIDGATIIDNKGNFIACGTIIKSVKSSIDGGGRLAATIQLSIYGTAIKISEDGGISAYHKEKKIVALG